MSRVYTMSGVTFGGSVSAAYAVDWLGVLTPYPIATVGVSVVGALGSLLWFYRAKFRVETEQVYDTKQREVVDVFRSVNSTSRKAAFVSFAGFQSLLLVPMVAMVSSPVIPAAIGLTGLVMGIAALAARFIPNVSSWQAPLVGGLIGLLGMNIVALIGPNEVSTLLCTVEPYLGIALFTAFTMYDTRATIETYKTKQPDHLHAVLSFYLNAINLLIRFVKLLSRRK